MAVDDMEVVGTPTARTLTIESMLMKHEQQISHVHDLVCVLALCAGGRDGAKALRPLVDAAARMAAVEQRVGQLEEIVRSEAAALESARATTLVMLQAQEEALKRMLAGVQEASDARDDGHGGHGSGGASGQRRRQQKQQQQQTAAATTTTKTKTAANAQQPSAAHSENPGSEATDASLESASELTGKPSRALAPISIEEFKRIPAYILGRLTRDRINTAITDLNHLIADKYIVLRTPQPKMTKLQRSIYWEHRQLATPETRNRVFITEKDLKDKKGWTTSTFKFDAIGRNVIALLRHLGRIREIRGGQHTRIVLM